MRRSDREVTDFEEIADILKRCDVCRLAFPGEDVPYVVPLNFGFRWEKGGRLRLYFHGAKEGTKIRRIEKYGRASFEMDTEHRLFYNPENGHCTMSYESVIGYGKIFLLPDAEKAEGLRILMDHYHPGENAYFNPKAVPNTAVFALEAEALTAKRRIPIERYGQQPLK